MDAAELIGLALHPDKQTKKDDNDDDDDDDDDKAPSSSSSSLWQDVWKYYDLDDQHTAWDQTKLKAFLEVCIVLFQIIKPSNTYIHTHTELLSFVYLPTYIPTYLHTYIQVICCLATLVHLGLLTRHAMLDKTEIAARLLFHPSAWIRHEVGR